MPTPFANSFRAPWTTLFAKAWQLGVFLILVFGLPRFALVLQANVSGNFQWVSIVFMAMWFTPWLLLTQAGRRSIGWKRPSSPIWLGWGLLLGGGCCLFLYAMFHLVAGAGISNAFVYIAQSSKPEQFSPTFFWIYLAISMTVSPIGEELFYRGVVHESFRIDLGEQSAAWIDSAAFALTHLAHFGIVFAGGKWQFLPGPALFWVTGMFATCLVFHLAKTHSGSLLGAVLAHAGFNGAMSVLLFYGW